MRDTALHGERTDIEVELRDVRTAEPADVVSSASPLNRADCGVACPHK